MDYIQAVREYYSGSAPRAFVEVFGCQQNEADGQALRGLLQAMGFTLADSAADTDLVLLNTCAVRDHAEQRALGHLGELRHSHKPGRVVVVCGCMGQLKNVQERLRSSFPLVNLVFGPGELKRFPELLYGVLTDKPRSAARRARHFHLTDPTAVIEEDLPTMRPNPAEALVSIMKGCDNFCTYCIVPHTRGRERSRPPQSIIHEVRELIHGGAREIMLLGQNVNSYRPPQDDGSGIHDFPDLLAALAVLPGDFSLRFMTSHPKDASDKLFEAMGRYDKLANQLHLPVQSGSDRILQAMNRRYTREHYIGRIRAARRHIPGVNLTSDIIVGFPGETEDDFRGTLELLRTVRFNALFTFLYSPRTGTPAAELVDDTPPEVKKARFAELLAVQKELEASL